MLYGFEEDLGIYVSPKHRRKTDNPYRLSRREGGRYWVSFYNGQGRLVETEICEALFHWFEKWERDDIAELDEQDNHMSGEPYEDETLSCESSTSRQPFLDQLLHEEEVAALRAAIKTLPEVQRRRVELYYFQKLTYEQIGELEGCTKMPVKRSIDSAIEKIKKFFQEEGLLLPKKMGKE